MLKMIHFPFLEAFQIFIAVIYVSEAKIFICEFHLKQAWRRWTSAAKNDVHHSQEDVLNLLNVRQKIL